MVTFTAEIEKFDQNGEKTGWRYIFIPTEMANQIKPGERKSIRVKGKIDHLIISGIALMPMGEGDFILPLKKEIRQQLKKEEGAKITVSLSFDADFKVEMPDDLEICLSDEPTLISQFMSMPKSHRNYFINWLNSAKTEATRTKRIIMIVNAMDKKQNYSEMIRGSRL